MQLTVSKLHQLSGHRDSVYGLAQGAEPHVVYSCGGDGQVIAWDLRHVEQATLLAKLDGSAYTLHHVAEAHTLVVGQNNEGLHLIDTRSRAHLGSLALLQAPIYGLANLGQLLVVALGGGGLWQVDLTTLAVTHRRRDSEDNARCVAFHPEGQQLAVGYSDGFVRVYSWPSLTLEHEVPAHHKAVFGVRFSPDGTRLLSVGQDAHLRSWHVATYTKAQEVVAHMYAIKDLTFSPRGKVLATSSMDKSIKLWSADDLRLLKVIDKGRHAGHGTSVNRLVWTDHHQQLVAASDDRSLSVWDIH